MTTSTTTSQPAATDHRRADDAGRPGDALAREAAAVARRERDLEERWYRAIVSRDPRFDGWVVVGVTSTGIYCRPSCPTPVRPKRENVTFHPTAAAAQRAGFRACKRCQPDAVPGSPAWDVRGDLAGRAMRLIADGVVDRDGVEGLADRLGVSSRHLLRVLDAEVGAGPQAIARAHRGQAARTLLETTSLPVGEVAFAAGFSSVRQLNDTVRDLYDRTPTGLRHHARSRRHDRRASTASADVTITLPVRHPFDADGLFAWFAARAIDGVERVDDEGYTRSLSLPGGPAVATVRPDGDHVRADLRLTSITDLAVVTSRLRRILDLDADPSVVNALLRRDPTLRRLVKATPGLRVPGTGSGVEAALLTIVGQQVSITSAARTCSTITATYARPLDPTMAAATGLTHAPLVAQDLADVDPSVLPMPTSRARALVEVFGLLATGELDLDPGADREAAHDRLLAVRGIGPWSADYLRLRGLGDPDVLMDTDLIVRRKAQALGLPDDLTSWAEPFAPWRSYVSHHLWAAPTGGTEDRRTR